MIPPSTFLLPTDYHEFKDLCFGSVYMQCLMSRVWENQAGATRWPDSDFDQIYTTYPSNRLIRHGKLHFSIRPNFTWFLGNSKSDFKTDWNFVKLEHLIKHHATLRSTWLEKMTKEHHQECIHPTEIKVPLVKLFHILLGQVIIKWFARGNGLRED